MLSTDAQYVRAGNVYGLISTSANPACSTMFVIFVSFGRMLRVTRGLDPRLQKILCREETVGSGDRARTCNILVNSQALYH